MNFREDFDKRTVLKLKSQGFSENQIGSTILVFDENALIEKEFPAVVLISACEPGEEDGLEAVRTAIYHLYLRASRLSIGDAGHYTGSRENLPETIATFRDFGCIPIVLSPAQSITLEAYFSYCLRNQTINIATVDEKPDLQEHNDICGEENWLTHLISHTPNHLFSLAQMGFQTYLSNPAHLSVLQNFHFDLVRLGELRNKISLTEPLFRNTDLFSFDLSAIRASDAPGSFRPGPNGLYAEEACQLCRYAGISNQTTTAVFSGWSPLGVDTLTASLIAQMVWLFMDGIASRIPDGKIGNADDYLVYKVSSAEVDDELVFFKNNRNGRWWMKVPSHTKSHGKPTRYHLVPCNYEDYQQALKGEIPETWWNTYQKLS